MPTDPQELERDLFGMTLTIGVLSIILTAVILIVLGYGAAMLVTKIL